MSGMEFGLGVEQKYLDPFSDLLRCEGHFHYHRSTAESRFRSGTEGRMRNVEECGWIDGYAADFQSSLPEADDPTSEE